MKVCCAVWVAVTTLPEEAIVDVNDEPDALAAEVVAETTLNIEGEVVVPVGSKPAIFVSVSVVSLKENMQSANEALLFEEL
ncbi:hypothetical protein [Aureimonas sp. AU4]|uniref:hypothetical protein n=1 Tax=Aureimonas sp. AU4 TaxID=1638163 RepID=UPI000783D846|nr:hypothetical protein [Aureimonas sp. AU4]